MTIKSILLSAIASGLYWAALGQTDLTHAELTYVETTSFVNKADKQIIRTVQHIYHLSPDFLKTTQYMNKNMTYTYLHDLNKRQTTVYLNNGEKFYRTTEKYAPIVFNIGKYRLHKPSVQLLGDTLTIAGYACKKALLTFSIEGKQATMQMWYCPDIRLATHLVDYPFTELPGIPVKFSFISKPEMSFETADIDVDCQFVLQNLNPRPNGNVVVENSERYVAMDESQKGNIIFEMMLAPSPGPIKSNRGKAITETVQGKDGITVSTIRYTPFAVGDTIAPFEGMDIHLQKVSHQHYADRLLVINFWFTRCGPCIQEMPYLNKVQALYKNKPVSFISITYDNKNEVEDFLAKRPFTFRPIVDAQHLIDQFNVSTYPLTIIVDKNRVVRFVKVGELKKGLEKTIDRLL